MLLRGLTWLVLFQLLGTAINHLFLPILPGPIIGLLLLLGYLIARGEVSEPLNLAAGACCVICRCCWCRRRWA
jgi:putative effector of murein hydrolase LrgA (UPF0299 family)